MNQPGRVFYVVKPTKFDPPLEALRRQFKQPTNRMMAMLLGNDTGPIIQGFFESVEKQAGFTDYLQDDRERR
jgi:hypothetical protein